MTLKFNLETIRNRTSLLSETRHILIFHFSRLASIATIYKTKKQHHIRAIRRIIAQSRAFLQSCFRMYINIRK